MQDKFNYVTPEQLCIGLYVHLDLGWMAHSFTFSSFKINSQKQIDEIRQLGLARIRYEPGKSDAKPQPVSPVPASAPVAVAPAPIPAVDAQAVAEKKARIEQLKHIRNEISEVEKQFQQAASAVKNITRNIHSRPQEALREAGVLVGQMVDTMLDKGDVMIHAMNNNLGEDVYFHSLNVTVLSLMLAKVLNMNADQLRQLGMGAMFHDIGKTEIPQKILMKTERLTKPEQSFLEMHCEYGVAIAKKAGLPSVALSIVLQHHEYVDGSGYPGKLTGDHISPLAKIVSIVNAYDNLCNPVNVANALTPYEALSRMFALTRAKFDEAALHAFIRCLGVYPPGSIVQLSNDMPGLVLSVNPDKPLKPIVLVYDPAIPQEEAVIIDLEQAPELIISKSLRPAQLAQEVYRYLNPRKRVTYYFDPRHPEGAR